MIYEEHILCLFFFVFDDLCFVLLLFEAVTDFRNIEWWTESVGEYYPMEIVRRCLALTDRNEKYKSVHFFGIIRNGRFEITYYLVIAPFTSQVNVLYSMVAYEEFLIEV